METTQSLTLTLSLWERERGSLGGFVTRLLFKGTAKEFPLPIGGGEGQGEGFAPIANRGAFLEKAELC